MRRARGASLSAVAVLCFACAGPEALREGEASGRSPEALEVEERGDRAGRHYLRDMVFSGRGDTFLVHWGRRKMPLAIHLPPPPPGLFANPDEVESAVRRAVLDWTDVAGPGVPRFEFVDDMGDADIPIVWADSPDGDWYIAFCSYDLNLAQLRMGVAHILVTGRWGNGEEASEGEIHKVMLHEMGHALGLGGHSDDPRDIMYPSIRSDAAGLSDADRLTLKKLYEHGSRRHSGRRRR